MDQVVISCGSEEIARHRRSYLRDGFVFNPIHYLPLLEQKTGALDQAAPLSGWVSRAATKWASYAGVTVDVIGGLDGRLISATHWTRHTHPGGATPSRHPAPLQPTLFTLGHATFERHRQALGRSAGVPR